MLYLAKEQRLGGQTATRATHTSNVILSYGAIVFFCRLQLK